MSSDIGREAVIQTLRERAPRAMHLGEVCSRMGVEKRNRDAVLDVLEDLAELGLVKQMPGQRFRVVDKSAQQRRPGFGRGSAAASMPHHVTDTVRGRLTQHPRGFGFVAAEDGGPDVFIPPDSAGTALQSDYVEVRSHPTNKGREGTVVRVLGRGLRELTGTVEKRGKSLWLDPDDVRLPGPMPLRGEVPKDARGGAAVLAKIIRYPEYRDELPEVEVTEVLGRHGTLEVEQLKILVREAVAEELSDASLDEANALPGKVTPSEKRDREDLRGIDLVTIDPADARDHDDAVWGERTDDGGWRVIVAIADVAHYVQSGSALDGEAFARGCSIYLPDGVIPMLPDRLSSDLASLVAGKDRLCLAVEIEVGPGGSVRGRRFIEGVMRSGGKLTYPGVARALGLTDEPPRQKEAEQRAEMLETLLELSRLLRKRRLRRGALDFDLPEAKVVMDEADQEPVDVVRSRKDPGVRDAYRLIEEMMLLANEVVAHEMTRRGVPTIYRVHGQPDEEKIEVFAELASALGYDLTPEDAVDPKKLAKFLRKIDGTQHQPVLAYLLLRAMQQAVYDTTNIGHFGLAAQDYVHFTSPIRRYPDLVVHRIVRKIVRGESIDPVHARPELRRAGAESSRLERRAMMVERDVVDLYRVALMQGREGEELDATVSHIAEHGFYTAFDEPFVEAVTKVERLEEDYFELDPLGLRLVGRRSGAVYGMGDRLRMYIEDVSLERREIVAVPVARLDEAGEDRRGPRSEREGERDGRKGRTRGGGKRRREPEGEGKGPGGRDERKARRDRKDRKRERRKERRGERQGGRGRKGSKRR